jgi:hypothetical protein
MTETICYKVATSISEFVAGNCPILLRLLLTHQFCANKLTHLGPPLLKEDVQYGCNVKSELCMIGNDGPIGSHTTLVQKNLRGQAEKQLQRNEDEIQEIFMLKLLSIFSLVTRLSMVQK